MRDPALPTFPITVTHDGPVPLAEQIATQVGAAVERGQVAGAGRLPSTRTLAAFLGVSRGVTAAAYELLGERGLLDSRPGSGAYARRASAERDPCPEPSSRAPIDLRPVAANAQLFPVGEWRAAWREATFRPPPAEAPPEQGLPELREAVAEHVVAALGLPVRAGNVLITTGPEQGLRTVLRHRGLRAGQVAVAEPAPVTAFAGTPVALEPDGEGPCVDAVPATCRALVVAADARMPLGRVMSARRRAEVAGWARRTGGTVIDIAADTGLSGPARRLPRLPGILLGGFGDPWGAALGLGFAVVPDGLGVRGERAPYPAQRALTTLLRSGAVDRLARRLHRLAAGRRDLVKASLGDVPGVRFDDDGTSGISALHLPASLDANAVAARLSARGVLLETAQARYFSRRPVPPALVFGWLRPGDAELRQGLATIRRVLLDMTTARPER